MATRRSRGEGGLFWHVDRQRWIATIDLGYGSDGGRRRRHISGRTKTEAKAKLLQARRELAEGLPAESKTVTVAEAVQDWLTYGMTGKDPSTKQNRRLMAERHVIPDLGARKLADLTTVEVDRWLAVKATHLSSDSVNRLLSILRRSLRRAQAQDLVRRNVALLSEAPKGRRGRPSKSLTLEQAKAVLEASESKPLHAYVVTAIMTGARTEELRALTWDHLDLDHDPPSIQVWRSVRRGGETKTEKSRRTLELPDRCVEALRARRAELIAKNAGALDPASLVFCTATGKPLGRVPQCCRPG